MFLCSEVAQTRVGISTGTLLELRLGPEHENLVSEPTVPCLHVRGNRFTISSTFFSSPI